MTVRSKPCPDTVETMSDPCVHTRTGRFRVSSGDEFRAALMFYLRPGDARPSRQKKMSLPTCCMLRMGARLWKQHGDQMASPSAVVFLLPTAAAAGPSWRPPGRILGGEVLSIAADTRCDARSRS